MSVSADFFKDTAERVAATAVQAAVAAGGAVLVTDLEANATTVVFVPAVAAGLAWAKAKLAKLFGNPESASLVK